MVFILDLCYYVKFVYRYAYEFDCLGLGLGLCLCLCLCICVYVNVYVCTYKTECRKLKSKISKKLIWIRYSHLTIFGWPNAETQP